MKERLDLLLVSPDEQKRLCGRLIDTLSGIVSPIEIALIASFVRRHGGFHKNH